MENIASLKEKWFKKEVERLANEGVSKADIARALDIKPQYLNSVLNGSRGLADTFLDKFIEAYNINQFDLLPHDGDSPSLLYHCVSWRSLMRKMPKSTTSSPNSVR